jgi:hypothetical protein
MSRFFFDTPWWFLAGAVAVAAALLISGNNRQDRPLKIAGLLVLALAILLGVLSYFVDTDIEKVSKRTRLMVDSVQKRDWKSFESLLDPHIHFAVYDDRASLVEGAKATADRIGLKSVHVTNTQATQDPTSITVNLDAISIQDATMDRPMPTSWRLEWQNGPDGWLLVHIDPLPNGQVTPDRVIERLVRQR